MTTLHKQNFDLKLELFHRRERQTHLEEAVERLEAEKEIAEQTNDKLVQEMEKRDKALEEAVQMIIGLENRIELLLREREMVKQLEANKALVSQLSQSTSATLVNQNNGTEKPHDNASPHDKHSLPRMPSFLSVRTENTETLRNVYLDTHASFLGSSKTDSRVGNNGFVSPSMSVLSESSFLSIYGQKTFDESSSPPDIPRNPQSRLVNNGQRSVSLPMTQFTPNGSRWSEYMRSPDDTKDALETRETKSALQGSKQLDDCSPAGNDVARTTTSGKDIDRSTTVRPIKPQPFLSLRKSKDRPSFTRKTISDEAISSQQALPPTPDTMTSSMLSQGQNLNNTSRRDHNSDEHKKPMSSRLAIDQTDIPEPGQWRFGAADAAQPPSITAFTGGRDRPGTAYYENRLSPLRRPRSADETTISRHKNDWDSCSDDDICSEASSFDYWMREGLRPSLGGPNKTQNDRMSACRNPPDLFGFPSDDKGWQSHDMFGARGGLGYLGSSVPVSQAVNTTAVSIPSSETAHFGSDLGDSNSPHTSGPAVPPPAPYRRSSLRARTSAPGTPMTERAPGSHGKYPEKDGHRKRSVSGHVLSSPGPKGWPTPSQTPTQPTHVPAQQQDKLTEKRHYPPHANQSQAAPRPRSRGITSLFRRSLGSTNTQLQPSASVPASQSPFPPPARKDASAPVVGVPAWERRNDLLDMGESATPPPIMRKRGSATVMDVDEGMNFHGPSPNDISRAGRGSHVVAGPPGLGAGLSAVLAGHEGGASLAPHDKDEPVHDDAPVQSSQGHGRKWFGLGRVTSLKTGGA